VEGLLWHAPASYGSLLAYCSLLLHAVEKVVARCRSSAQGQEVVLLLPIVGVGAGTQ
jgi:hypothetical protein